MAYVLGFVDDLMFLSRIREAALPQGVEVRSARNVDALLNECRAERPAAVLFDLDTPRLPSLDALRAVRGEPTLAGLTLVGFYNHAYADKAEAAQAAGCSQVLTRGAFVTSLPALLAEAAATSGRDAQ